MVQTRMMMALAAAACAIPAQAEPARPGSVGPVSVVDVDAGEIRAMQRIEIDGESIGGVTRFEGMSAGEVLYAVPGLIDSHVHYSPAPILNGLQMIAHGVVMVRDLGAATTDILEIRDELESGSMLGPAMICSGAIVDGSPPIWPFSEECSTPEEARAAVRKLANAGVDFIKVYSRLKPEVYAAACDEARALGLRAVGHIPESVDIDGAIAAGQYTNEHLMRMPSEFVPRARQGEGSPMPDWWWHYEEADPADIDAFCAKIAGSGMVQCPTLIVTEGIRKAGDGTGVEDERMRYVAPTLKQFWNMPMYARWGETLARTNPYRLDLVGRLHEAGVIIVAGTDLANPFVFAGSGLHEEVGLLMDAGMDDRAALASATTVPARVFDVDDRFGAIEPGREASFFLTPVNPLEDLRGALASMHAVVHRGTYYGREDLDELMERSAREASGEMVAEEPAGDKRAIVGEVIHQGRYELMFGQFPAGHEEFVITRTDDGSYRIYSSVRPGNGPQAPSDSVYYLDAQKRLVKVEYNVDSRNPTSVVYEIDADEVTTTVYAEDGSVAERTTGTLGEDGTLAGLSWVSNFFATDDLGVHAMEVGERHEYTSAGFGWSGTSIGKAPASLARVEDAPAFEGGDVCRVFDGEAQTPMGMMKTRSWVDAEGVTVRARLVMPFGTLTAELEN